MSKANETQVGGEHYKKHRIQPWDAIVDWKLGFLDGNVVKYIARYREKGGLEDLHKAKHYLEKLLEVESNREAIETIQRDFEKYQQDVQAQIDAAVKYYNNAK